jgi:hypothetical protein
VIRWALIAVLTGGVLVVASENRTDPVMVQLLFGFRAPPLSVAGLILLSFGAGAAAVALSVVPAWLRASLRVRRQRREIESLEDQVAAGNAPPAVAPGATPPHDFV